MKWGTVVSEGMRAYSMVDSDVLAMVCPDCGALVADRAEHDKWHDVNETVIGPDDRCIIRMGYDVPRDELIEVMTWLDKLGIRDRTLVIAGQDINVYVVGKGQTVERIERGA